MDAKTLIEKVGTTTEVAALCDVSPAAVSQWKSEDGDGIPSARLMYLKLARPDLPWHKYKPPAKRVAA